MFDNEYIGDRECFGLSHDDMTCACIPKELIHKFTNMNNDFAVYLHERYNMTKAEMQADMDSILNNPIFSACEPNDYVPLNRYHYEERSCGREKPNVEFDKLYVGAKLYLSTNIDNIMGPIRYEEALITHVYADAAFYKWLTGPRVGEPETHLNKGSLAFYLSVYPMIIYKPKGMNLVCDCTKTQILDYPEEA